MYKVYGKPNCSYCNKAKQLLDKQNIEYSYIDLTVDLEALNNFKSQGFKTVPIIYQSGDLIGGYEALYNHLSK